MATIATMTMLKPAKIVSSSSSKAPMSMSLRSLPHKKAKLSSASSSSSPSAAAASALAGAFFSTLASSDAPALAAQQVADAGSDSRGTLLLLVVSPAIGWVLYNILQPALNQLNRMRSSQGAVAAGLGGLGAAAGVLACAAPEASAAAAAQDLVASLAAAAPADDNRGTLLLLVVAPAIVWVLYNILQPALNQLNRMRKD